MKTRLRHIIIAFILILLVSTTIWIKTAKHPNQIEYQTMATEHSYIIFSNSNKSKFKVEVATTPQQREKGLMFRKTMEADEGMLFIFEDERIRSFWMKNTFIPLDIIFLDSNFQIITMHENTKPNNTDITYKSSATSQFVIELNAGTCQKENIKLGDYVAFSTQT